MLRKHIIPPLLGVLVCILLIVMFGKTPVAALQSLFADSFTSAYYFGNMLNTAAFFMIAGTGSALAIKSGNMNLGGEGQVYLGGYIGCLVLVRSKKSVVVAVVRVHALAGFLAPLRDLGDLL